MGARVAWCLFSSRGKCFDSETCDRDVTLGSGMLGDDSSSIWRSSAIMSSISKESHELGSIGMAGWSGGGGAGVGGGGGVGCTCAGIPSECNISLTASDSMSDISSRVHGSGIVGTGAGEGTGGRDA